MKRTASPQKGLILFGLLIVLLISPLARTATSDLPLTTNSAQARKSYNDGLAFYDKGQFTAAFDKFTQAIRADSNLAMAYLMLSNILYYEGNYKKGDMMLERAAKITNLSETENLLIDLFKAFTSQDQEKQKLTIERLVTKYPSNTQVQELNGFYLRNSRKMDESIQVLQQAVAHAPTYAHYVQLGYSYQALKKYDEAAASFRKAIAIAPENAAAQTGLGYTLRKSGKFDEAIKIYEQVLNLNSGQIRALSGLGDVYLVTNKAEQARQIFQKMLESAKDHQQKAWAHEQMAAYHVLVDQLDRACDEFAKITDIYEKAGDLEELVRKYRQRTFIYVALGKRSEASMVGDKWLDLVESTDKSETFKNMQKATYFVLMTTSALAHGDIQQAKLLEQEFLELKIDKITETDQYRQIRAAIVAAEGRYDEALAIATDKGQPLFLARVYRDKGDKTKARAYYEKLLDVNHDWLFWRLLDKKQATDALAKL